VARFAAHRRVPGGSNYEQRKSEPAQQSKGCAETGTEERPCGAPERQEEPARREARQATLGLIRPFLSDTLPPARPGREGISILIRFLRQREFYRACFLGDLMILHLL